MKEFDFGFSFTDEEEITQQTKNAIVIDYEARVKGLRDMIMPLLMNLKSNPESTHIYWPDRVEKIDEFIGKINDYVEGK